ncbi:cuticle protein 19.8-like [Panulirus ornatus]|uniref:cuticle protein 19.8-like n=1 Tax=Panulirus ornatus TaxID=150431 RepID=UPI003A8AA0F5
MTSQMMQVLVLATLVAVALAHPAIRPPYHPHPPSYAPVDPPKYDFNYAVRDNFGNDFGHQESRDGYNTQGSYYAQLPDGRLQKVDYTVQGDSGFVAQVGYQGQAQYPTYHPAPAPSYSPAPHYG